MLDFKEVGLGDKEIIDCYLKEDFFQISDISFANLYIWRWARKIAYTIIEECLIIQTTYENQKPFYFFPIGRGDKKRAIEILLQSQEAPLEFHSLQKQSVAFLQKYFDGMFDFSLNLDRSDYVYDVQELIALSGRKYHKKKNHLNKFLQTYPHFVFEHIDKTNKDEILYVWKQWFEAQNNPSQGLIDENKGIVDVLQNWEALGLMGGLVRVDQKIIAFSFGEIINEEMVVMHIEKADSHFAGAYQIINQQMLQHIFFHMKYVNREEDLGIEGLRKAKMSYNPVFLVEKYQAVQITA